MAGETKLINKRGVANRYGGCALRTVQRWVQAGVLPPPDMVINGRGYWNEAGSMSTTASASSTPDAI